jgi:tRNA(Ile)-lysidine synthase
MSILAHAIDQVPAGPWAVAVSGGADSVALFRLLLGRPDLSLHVVHLDHQTRGEASTADAEFVQQLAAEHRVPCTVALRNEIEPQLEDLPKNPSARYRAARMELFRQVVSQSNLNGVILAHHADDQAETVLHRLIRGSGPAGLAGMLPQTRIDGLFILRLLLAVRRKDLRKYLSDIGQSWREDASNESDHYLRNRLRRWLGREPGLHESLLTLGNSCRKLREWSRREAPVLEESFAVGKLSQLPDVLACESARRWLVARGAPAGELSEAVLDRLVQMAQDAASAPRTQFPGSLLVRRRRGIISAAH